MGLKKSLIWAIFFCIIQKNVVTLQANCILVWEFSETTTIKSIVK